jgi:hypothetical protein
MTPEGMRLEWKGRYPETCRIKEKEEQKEEGVQPNPQSGISPGERLHKLRGLSYPIS